MLPVGVVKVAQIAAGYLVGSLASDAVNAAGRGIKKVVVKVKDKKKETQK